MNREPVKNLKLTKKKEKCLMIVKWRDRERDRERERERESERESCSKRTRFEATAFLQLHFHRLQIKKKINR